MVRPANAAQARYADARELAAQVDVQFGAVRFSSSGIAGGSCCAGLAVTPAPPNWPAAVSALNGAALPFAVVYGNSRMMAAGLAVGVQGGHAERAAMTAAANEPLTLHLDAANAAVIYVELLPCIAGHNCHGWMGLDGVAAQHPYAAAPHLPAAAVTLNVWYGHANAVNMATHHGLTVPNQLLAIGAW